MSISDVERQRHRREKMRTLNFTYVQIWVPKDRALEIKSIAMRMRDEGSKDTEPSQKQLEFAQFLCDKKGLKIQNDVLSSSKKLSEWINRNKKKEDKTNES
jgi:hypothetical protein